MEVPPACRKCILAALPSKPEGRENLYRKLRDHFSEKCTNREFPPLPSSKLNPKISLFGLPTNLHQGSLDNLFDMVDKIGRGDALVERCLRRAENALRERGYTEELKVVWHKDEFSFYEYMDHFSWDHSRYPPWQTLQVMFSSLVASVQKMDDELCNRLASLGEIEKQVFKMRHPDSLVTRSIARSEIQEAIDHKKVVNSAFLSTVFVVVPEAQLKNFVKKYEYVSPLVVPRSATKLNVTDSDNNTLWLVTLCRSEIGNFRNEMKSLRCIVREHDWESAPKSKVISEAAKLDIEYGRHTAVVEKMCLSVFSELTIAWVHLKAMKLYVEGVLRYGTACDIASFVIVPPDNGHVLDVVGEICKIELVREGEDRFESFKGDIAEADYVCVLTTFTPQREIVAL